MAQLEGAHHCNQGCKFKSCYHNKKEERRKKERETVILHLAINKQNIYLQICPVQTPTPPFHHTNLKKTEYMQQLIATGNRGRKEQNRENEEET